MADIMIAHASEPDLAACLALLPGVRGLPAEFLVARQADRLLGAACVVWRSSSEPRGFPLAVEVVPGARRRGIGRALVAAAVRLSAGEMPGLWSAGSVDAGGPEAAFFLACGFEPLRRQTLFQLGMRDLLARIEPLVGWLRTRGDIPDSARFSPLSQAPLEEIGWWMSDDFGSGPITALRTLAERGDTRANPHDRSLVLMIDGEPAAVLLLHRDQDIGVVDTRVVAPKWRRSWPSVVILEEALRRGLAEGVEFVRFLSDDVSADTMMLAALQGAETVSERAFFYYAAARRR